ncbi:hypothetical protein BT96DRAFT_997515 [Gymnopus androsaceus JB14]|uniref:Uncharacterized protein n=1 Tax=Gymnopus androsaceus JB14 TaxID=1447944 RepID=A0A6A4HEV7_9AGAR|nr:hypothetical protein BT96DRAFT_997515 [Gymnopus androsaceus JB14]
MSNTLVLATYSKASRYLDKVLSVVEEITEAVIDMPDTYINDIPHIRAIVDNLDPIIHERIPTLLAILRKQPLPPIRTHTGHDLFPLYVKVFHVDPTLILVLKALKRCLLDLSRRLDQWPLRSVILEGVIIDMEGVLKEMIPELRTAITRNELTDSEYRRMFATVNPPHANNAANDDIGSTRDGSVTPSDASDDILDTTTVNKWLATRPSSMSRIGSPPIYDSDHPDHEGHLDEEDDEGHLDEEDGEEQ